MKASAYTCFARVLACGALWLAGCGGSTASSGKPRTPFYHSSLTSPYVRPLLPRFSSEPGALEGGEAISKVQDEDKRTHRAATSAPVQDTGTGSHCDGHGESMVQQALAGVAAKVRWSASDGLGELVRLAQERRAYRVDGSPEAGDIVLFHNTRDANGDRQNNDWLSSAGVVVQAGEQFEARVCVDGNLRLVRAWPDGPAVREYHGRVVNSFLRVPTHNDAPGTAYLAGSLYAGHIDIDRLLD